MMGINRYWQINNPNGYIGTIPASNPLKIAIPIMKVNESYEYKIFNSSVRQISKISKQGKINIPIANNHSANQVGVSVIPTISCNGTVKTPVPAIDAIPGIPIFLINGKPYHLRILTPKEAWLLMGFTNDDFTKVHDMPKTHLYHMAGNSIVVPVLEAIFKELLKLN